MAQTQALSIYTTEDAQAYLKNVIVGIFENLAKTTISGKLKSKNANLSKKAGSYEFKRFANATVRDYGTARAAGKGDKVVAPPVVVNLDKNKEIVEEVNFFDSDGSFTDEAFQQFVNNRKINFTCLKCFCSVVINWGDFNTFSLNSFTNIVLCFHICSINFNAC